MTVDQLHADILFLAKRQQRAGSFSMRKGRDTGISSNSLVSFAYGVGDIEWPRDWSDYAACVRAFRKLPTHRRTPSVIEALALQREAVTKNYSVAERRKWSKSTKATA